MSPFQVLTWQVTVYDVTVPFYRNDAHRWSRGTIVFDNKAIEALYKFMKVFNKKRMEM
jgi:hypothetical protein